MADATRVDAHQHFWSLGEVQHPWLDPSAYGPIHRDFGPGDLEPLLRRVGIAHTITVQSANSFADTDAMLAHADRHPWIAAVTGWVPLLEPGEAERALDRYCRHPAFRGVRHLVHDEPDPDWLMLRRVRESLTLLAERGLVFEIPAVFPRHLVHVPRLAEEHPGLKIVIDHLGKPPIASGALEPWWTQLATAATHPNVYAKLSGLNTVAAEEWSAEDLRPFVDAAADAFGPDRLMFGSDWPVCLMAGDYERVWAETVRALDGASMAARDAVLGGTAAAVYGLAR
ncbi:MAG TPA: amidohydrolase family protein [Solirubrobacteraceae bacterium]